MHLLWEVGGPDKVVGGHDRRWKSSESNIGSWECFTALLIVPGSQPFLLNAWVHFSSLRGIRKELCPNGFINQERKGGGTRLGEILERKGRLKQSRRWR